MNRDFATTIESVFDQLRTAGVLPAELQRGLDMLVDARHLRLKG